MNCKFLWLFELSPCFWSFIELIMLSICLLSECPIFNLLYWIDLIFMYNKTKSHILIQFIPWLCIGTFLLYFQIKSNVVMKRININQRPTPVARGPPEPHAKIPLNACGFDGDCGLYPLVSPPDVARSLLWCLCPLQSLCPALSSGVNHNATARMAAHPISVSFQQPDLGVQYHPWSKVSIRGTDSTTPFNG